MSLVAYGSGSSDESEGEDVVSTNTVPGHLLPQCAEKLQSTTKPLSDQRLIGLTMIKEDSLRTPTTASKSFSEGLPKPKYDVGDIELNEQKKSNLGQGLVLGSSLFASLPKPKHDACDIGTNKVKFSTSQSTKTVKITVPSLAQFKDTDDEEPVKKKPKPSSKGSGLFSLLPPPKNLIVKETKRALVPHVLTKKPSDPPVKSTPPVAVQVKKPSVALISYGYPDSGEESEEEGGTARDFFSLSTKEELPDLGESVAVDFSAPIGPQLKTMEKIPENDVMHDEPLAFVSGFQTSVWKNIPAGPSSALQSTSEESTSQEFSEQEDYLSVVEDDLQLDEEAVSILDLITLKSTYRPFINH